MNAREYVAFLTSPAGMLIMKDAVSILDSASPEEPDSSILARVVALGFPHWVAVRIFKHHTNRFAPLVCRTCQKQFKPRSVRTVDRPYCHQCFNGEPTPVQAKKNRARRLSAQAEASGKIKRKPCSVCGWEFSEMHHPDYGRPLHVIWLCKRCHTAEHSK